MIYKVEIAHNLGILKDDNARIKQTQIVKKLQGALDIIFTHALATNA